MNVFTWFTLIASFICISFGVIVYSFNRRTLINKVFAVATLFAFIYAFTEAMMLGNQVAMKLLFYGARWALFGHSL